MRKLAPVAVDANFLWKKMAWTWSSHRLRFPQGGSSFHNYSLSIALQLVLCLGLDTSGMKCFVCVTAAQ